MTTTHEWASDVDATHLADVRSRLGQVEAAGGRRHLILEVLAYADEEAEHLGRVGAATVTTHADGKITVSDDGRGTDTRRDTDGRVIRKPVMATQDVRFADVEASPRLPDGLPRRGMSTVAALSSVLLHENHRESGSWSQTYRHGIPDEDLAEIEPRASTGTTVTFLTDLTGPPDLTEEDADHFRWLTIRRHDEPERQPLQPVHGVP